MKKLMAVILAVCTLLSCFGGFSVHAGNDSITYTYDEETKTLYIEGEGEMDDYYWWNNVYAPWVGYKNTAEKAVIGEGITYIGMSAFEDFTALREISLPSTVEKLGTHSFSGSGLYSIDIPASVTEISYMAFVNCGSMQSYNVAEENEYYCSVDGVLFSEDMKVLKVYPLAKIEEEGIYTVPDEVEVMEGYAFSEAVNLFGVVIGENVKSIGDECFIHCKNLASVEFNTDKLEFIGGGVFQHCRALAEVTLPGTVKTIRPLAFFDTEFYRNRENWEGDLLYIGEYLISGEYYLIDEDWDVEEEIFAGGSIDVKEGTVLIAGSAFSWFGWDSQITDVRFPFSLKYVNEYAFSSCDKISTVNLPSTVITIEEGAFRWCSLLSSVSLGSNIESIGMGAFADTPITSGGNGLIYEDGYLLGYGGSLPEEINIIEGTRLIADNALAGGGIYSYHNFKVNIPESVKYIGREAFVNTKINDLTVPDTVLTIGEYAFGYKKTYDNDAEEYVYTLMSGMNIEGSEGSAAEDYANKNGIGFVDPTAPVKIVFGCFTAIEEFGGLTIVDFNWDDSYSPEIDIPVAHYEKTVRRIAKGAFKDCTRFEYIDIHEYVEVIDDGAFEDCDGVLFKVKCSSEGLRYAEANGLNYEMEHIFPPEANGVVTICTQCNKTYCDIFGHVPSGAGGKCVRSGCEYVENDDLGGSGSGGSDIEIVIPVPEGLSYRIYEGTAIISGYSGSAAEVVIPDTIEGCPVVEIGGYAFENCTGVESITVPEGVKDIMFGVFRGCTNLKTVSLPESVTSVGNYAFYGCENLETVYYGGSNITWNGITMGKNNDLLLSADIVFARYDEPIYEKGDVNGDGAVNAMDSLYIRNIIAGNVVAEAGSPEFLMADLNGDGKVNIKDSYILKKILSE